MKIECQQYIGALNQEFAPYVFYAEDVVEFADRSSAEIELTWIYLNDGSSHLITIPHDHLRLKLIEMDSE